MKTVELTLYTFAELSETAKQYAHEKHLQHHQNPWSSENYDSLVKFVELIPNLSLQRRGSGFSTGQMDDAILELSGPRLMAWLWSNLGSKIFKGKYYSKFCGNVYKSRRSNCILVSECPLTGFWMDIEVLEPVLQYMRKGGKSTLAELLGTVYRNWECAVELDDEQSSSMEAFADDCEANEWTFEESGRMNNA
jgi:hypothetical protein